MASNKNTAPPGAAGGPRKVYMAWLETVDDIKGPQELSLTVRDISPGRHKYEAHNVVAVVSPTSLPEGEVLWVRYANGRLISQPWSIKIIRELPEFFPGRPYSGVVD